MPVPTPARRARRSSAAPGQFLGYALQELRVAAHLFRAVSDADVVSLEVVGDTSVHAPDGRVTTEEHKSRMSKSNPVADESEDLWKTLRNWVEAAERLELDPARTTFCLHVSRAFEGDIVRRLHNARSTNEAAEALQYAAERVWRAPEGRSLVGALPLRTQEHVASVFSADRTLVASIVERFIVEYGSGDSWADLRQAAAVAAIETELLDDFLRDVVGWVKQEITGHLQRGQAAALSARDFRAHLRAVRRRLDSQVILASAAPGPDAVAIKRHLQKVQMYVWQLELIDANDEEKFEAARDYLRASNDRVAWAHRGLVHQASFDDFETDLESAWQRKKRITELTEDDRPPAAQGMLLYLACCEHSAKLNGLEPPPAFCRGSFHALADHVRIGWHPEYTRLLHERSRGARKRRHRNSGSEP